VNLGDVTVVREGQTALDRMIRITRFVDAAAG
jgi:hypothetical protein